MEEKILSIINNYGAEHQQEKLKEEYDEQLDRIERMLLTLLNETDKEKFKNEKIEKYKIQLNLYEKMLKQEEDILNSLGDDNCD